MGILDSIVGGLTEGTAHEGLAASVMEMLGGTSGSNGAAIGLRVLAEKLSAGGLGEIVRSWIGTGANLPVSADQIKAALDSDTLQHLAQKVGLSPEAVAPLLAQILPGVVDKLTPAGQLPELP